MLRSRMRHIIELLEKNSFSEVESEILHPDNSKALRALIDTGCVKPVTVWGGRIVDIELLNHSVTYQLERREIWLNRLYGFIAGVATSVVAGLLLYIML